MNYPSGVLYKIYTRPRMLETPRDYKSGSLYYNHRIDFIIVRDDNFHVRYDGCFEHHIFGILTYGDFSNCDNFIDRDVLFLSYFLFVSLTHIPLLFIRCSQDLLANNYSSLSIVV